MFLGINRRQADRRGPLTTMPVGLWADRLVEVWAPPGRAGAGVLVGDKGVLTARHVVENALAGGPARLLARVVRPGVSVGDWVPVNIVWESSGWDVALLTVDNESRDAGRWLIPTSPPVIVAALGTGVEQDCEAIGFPQSAAA